MRNFTEEQIVYLGTSKPEANFSADPTTNVITSTAHGLQNGDIVQFTASEGGSLPDGLFENTNYYVRDATADTFKVSAIPGGPEVDIIDEGIGTHTYHLKGRAVYVADWEHIVVSLHFIDNPTMTIKFQGSLADTCPDFNADPSYTNRWDYVEVIDMEDGTAIDGDTGVSCSGSEDNRLFEVNVSALKWLSVVITSYTVGRLDVRVSNYQ